MVLPVSTVTRFWMFLDIIEHVCLVFGPLLTRPPSFLYRFFCRFLCLVDHFEHLSKPRRRHQDLIFGGGGVPRKVVEGVCVCAARGVSAGRSEKFERNKSRRKNSFFCRNSILLPTSKQNIFFSPDSKTKSKHFEEKNRKNRFFFRKTRKQQLETFARKKHGKSRFFKKTKKTMN